jgi:hypothetical protein
MISLASYEPIAAPSTFAIDRKADDLLSAILDCAEFYRWRQNDDGSETAFFILRKPLPGLPAGIVLSLSDLHERLFGKALK